MDNSNHKRKQRHALAYVPRPRTPHHDEEDGPGYPLDFYGAHSGQRYPRLTAPASTARPPPAYGPLPSFTFPARKPAPASAPPFTHYSSRDIAPHRQGPTPPMSSPPRGPLPTPPAAQPKRHSSTESFGFPPSLSNVRRDEEDYEDDPKPEPENEVPQSYDPYPYPYATTVTPNQAGMYQALLAAHPSTQPPSPPTPPSPPRPALFPPFQRAATPSPPPTATPKKPSTPFKETLKSLSRKKSFSKKHRTPSPPPPLPPPAFIAPRPALAQRYVSAGGTERLEDRAEIPGPVFSRPPTAPARISVRDYALTRSERTCETLQPVALAHPTPTLQSRFSPDDPRRSDESGTGGPSWFSFDAARRSAEHRKRERTTSSASGRSRMAKLKKVFSRKSSSVDEEAVE